MPSTLLRILIIATSLTGCGPGRKADSGTQTTFDTPQSQKPPATALVVSAATRKNPSILEWETVETLPEQIAVFDHVFWEPDDTSSLRELLRTTDVVHDKSVLEIGTGTGIVSLCCVQAGAVRIVATDINPWAARNAAFNAELLNFNDRMQVRLVPQKRPLAWSVIHRDEHFDVIISNPPWELGRATRVEDFAFYDPDFRLMESIVSGLPEHLNPNGRAFLAYGHVPAIRQLKMLLKHNNLPFRTRDQRSLDDLPESFLPGMLLEVRLHDSFDTP
ncbi:MAG: 50S ribosomal protein L11 methyltransferase [Fuerstiella sp.]|jgi:release factor glutamine methyltransferase|nr:50S ribosomal protein L11 methyltransferase [Fuerstiella sp.]